MSSGDCSAGVGRYTRAVRRVATGNDLALALVGALTIIATAAFAILVGTAPARFMGVDDAFYLGIGANIFAGRGPVTAFGSFAPQHAPLWPIAITAPGAWFGIDGPGWAHLLVMVSGASVILLAAWFAWRALPLAAALTAGAMLGFPFMISLGTGMGLDLPAAALALAYVAVGLAAVRRGSAGLGAVAGLLFAAAFLTKEIALPFAPVPLLAALVRGAPTRGLIRATAATLLVGLAATSWWFVIYAQRLGTVYRIGTPWWTLIPIAIVALLAGVFGLGLAGSRWLPAPDVPATDGGRRRSWLAGWIGAAVWAVLLTVMFARTPTGLGTSFLVPSQVANNLAKWFPDLGSVLAIGLVGSAYEVAQRFGRWSGRSPMRTIDSYAIDDLLIATICGFPLVLLVVSVGEGPRHYIAQLAVLVAIGACGWVRIADRAARRDRAGIVLAIVALAVGLALALPTVVPLVTSRLGLRLAVLAAAIVVIGLVATRAGAFKRIGSRRDGVAVTALTTIVGSAIVLTSVLVPQHQSSIDRTRADAVRTIAAWIRASVPAGSPVGVASGLAFELGLPLQAEYRMWQLRDEAGVHVRPEAPLGVATDGEPDADDWLALRASPTDVQSLYGYRASTIVDRLRDLGQTIWIHAEVTSENQASPIVEALSEATGVSVAARWDWPYGADRLEATAFAIDPSRLEFPGRLVVTPQALQRIVAGLEAGGATSQMAAANLLARVDVAGTDSAAGVLDRLRRLAVP
jgi:hypothetical protein